MFEKYPCPCCGYLVFDHQPGHHQVCPICCWEDDMAQLRFPLMPASANLVSLICAQKNYADSGISTRLGNNQVRTPNDGEIRDPAWRPLDMARDNPEEPQRGIDYRKSYPTSDATVLYYWRASYWRRLVS